MSSPRGSLICNPAPLNIIFTINFKTAIKPWWIGYKRDVFVGQRSQDRCKQVCFCCFTKRLVIAWGNNAGNEWYYWSDLLNILHWWIHVLSLHETSHLWTNRDMLFMNELQKQGVKICWLTITELKRPWRHVSKSCKIRRENGLQEWCVKINDDCTQLTWCKYVIWNS